ncbi:MAG: hypothetical protein JOZ40_03415, partial [Methylobacteriaceae bacterium]|nr:hypothetical protein [Methylobacteriaceae bacterium]
MTWRAGRVFARAAAWNGWLVLLFSGLPVLIAISTAMAAEPAEIKIGYLRQPLEKFTISYRDQPAENDGLAGALVAIDDNNTTGKFLNQKFTLEDVKLKEGADPTAAVNALADKGILFVVADLDPDALLKAADAGKARGVL